ncbi:MAG TPA: FAD:protein FMN transferase [Candidatus Hydrothermia bacterium]|nr:FAD:protein FMN transferase [Candidatus Hydrothermae bacterium]MDD3648975.1 FAD:protein FMN transferase [Candidatus Hydrothermia bacterium]HRD22246.1 FAD:protein FMN transferase [Candidatus Hydrothermia bacterium]
MNRFLQPIFLFLLLLIGGCSKREAFKTKTYMVMGTVLNVTLPESTSYLSDSVYEIFRTIDSLMNPIKETSDIFKINISKGFVKVHPYTADCIAKALEVAEMTDGAFDITVGSIVHLWHFDEQGKYIFPPLDSIEKYKGYVDYRKVKIQDGMVKVGKNQMITLAGIAKGYAIQLAANFLHNKGVTSALIDAGGDLFLLGTRNGKKWRVGIRNPYGEDIVDVISLSNTSCCTSGDYERYIEQDGKRYSHIFSPFTGYPVSNGVRSVTVVYADAIYCDALATAIFVLGPDGAQKLRERVKGIEYYIITDDTTYLSDGFRGFF